MSTRTLQELWLRFPQLLSDCWTCAKIQMADCLVGCVGRPRQNLCNKDILAAGWFAPVIWVRSVRCLFGIMLGLTHELRPNRAREITFTQLTPWAPLYFGGGGGAAGVCKEKWHPSVLVLSEGWSEVHWFLEELSKTVDTLGSDLSIAHLLGKGIFIAMLPSEGGTEQKTSCMALVEKKKDFYPLVVIDPAR